MIVARQDSGVRSLDDVAGKVAAINGHDSQSGWNALRHSLIGKGAPARFVETGGHRKSMAAVREGRADSPPSIASPLPASRRSRRTRSPPCA